MTMNWRNGCAALVLVLLLCSCRQACAVSTYSLECNANMQGRITVQLNSFRVQVTPPGASVAGPQQHHYELTVHFPAGRAYTAFHSVIDRNENMHTCKLTETETGASPASRTGNNAAPTGMARPVDSLEWDFSEGTVTSVVALGSDGTSTTGNVAPQGSMQVVFLFQSLTVIAKP